MSNTTDSKILNKIEKLLRLSASSNQHEAEAAMAAAVRLATLHDIDMSRVSLDSNVAEETIDKTTVSMGSRLPVTFAYTQGIVGKFFKVKLLIGGGRLGGRVLHFIGKPDDIDNAKFVFSFLNETFLRLWQNHYKRNPHLDVATARKCYFLGLYQGLSDKLTQVQKQTVDEAFTDSASKDSYQLVVVDYKKKLDDAVAAFFGKTKSTPNIKRSFRDRDTIQAGFRAGQDIQIHAGLTNKERIAIK